MEKVENLLKPFVTEIRLTMIYRFANVLTARAGADNNGGNSEFVCCKQIHLLREGVSDRAAAVNILWHELLHFGLCRQVYP